MNAFFLFRFFSQANKSTESFPATNQEINKKILNLLVSTPERIWASSTQFKTPTEPVLSQVGLWILHHLLNQDSISAQKIIQMVPQSVTEEAEWMKVYLSLLGHATQRLSRTISIEKFENFLEDFDWNLLPESIIQESLLLIGYIYLQEDLPESRKKCKPWLERLSYPKEANPNHLMAQTLLFDYHISLPEPSSAVQVEKWANSIENFEPIQAEDKHLVLLMRFRNRIREVIQYPEQAPSFLTKTIDDLTQSDKYSDVNKVSLFFTLITEIHPLFFKVEASQAALYSLQLLKLSETLEIISMLAKENESFQYRLNALNIPLLVYAGRNKIAWEKTNELILHFKQVHCFRPLIQLGIFLENTWSNADQVGMAEKFLTQNIHYLLQRKETFEAEPLVYLLKSLNELYIREFAKPGVSPFIQNIPTYLELHTRFVLLQENFPEETGLSLFRIYQNEFRKVEEVSKYNIHSSLSFYLLQLRVLALSCQFNHDSHGYEIARQIIRKIDNPLNPLHFLNGRWEDFKDVPNTIRNTIINQTISITKGDLPAASEHLKFSYRNLRSYISLNEVNRLGNFLKEQVTSSRSLEEGIRLMFHDLYLKGHIFEVVFDMPAFLVRKSGTGFSAKDMEVELEVKPSTAKKYIRILQETGMIELNPNEGKKANLKLSIDKIMRRYAEEKSKKTS
jgi:hypothetical protein